ncbi:FecR domain-containing protein [bacterium]|nr:FecR domain-containing protein [bacterium]
MKHALYLTMLCCFSGQAEEPVVRVQSIKPADGSGKSTLLQKRPGDTASYPVSVNTTGYIKDHFMTDQNTLAALEFLIGGRVGINKDTDIEIVSERSVADGKTEVKRIILKNGSLWVKADAKQLKQPLEIQTNGGAMGIKGTEFTVDQEEDGTVQVCCFESNSELGGVEIRDAAGQVVGVARPGDEYRIHRQRKAQIQRFKNVQEFRQKILSGRRFSQMHKDEYFAKRFMGDVGKYPSVDKARAYHYAQNHPRLVKNSSARLRKMRNNQRRAQAFSFPSQLNPDASDAALSQASQHPRFSWRGVAADGYVVTVSRDAESNEVLFTDRVKQTSLSYPADMRPLDPGRYYWRVIPVDAQDQPVLEASQAEFLVEGPSQSGPK